MHTIVPWPLEESLVKLRFNFKDFPLGVLKTHKGIERETLRVDGNGHISQKGHPYKLGSKLTHPYITTDYAESLIEFVTPVRESNQELYQFLKDLHSYTADILEDEYLWSCSMPPKIESEEDIAIADYGTSHSGLLKKYYRMGLSHRYGNSMQVIAGVHYNFSFGEEFLNHICDTKDRHQVDDFYMGVVRNFKRYNWILVQLFGASPVCDQSFLKNKEHFLKEIVESTFGKECNTSLRLDRLGYTSDAQKDIFVCNNSLDTYVETH
jgi:glutamate--cysteine ligase